MPRTYRYLLLVISAAQLFFAAAFYLQLPFATALWPFEGTTPLTFIFAASFFGAAGASTIWAVTSGNDGALAGIGLDYAAIFGPLSIFAIFTGLGQGDTRMALFGAAAAVGAVVGIGLLTAAARIRLDRTIPMPGLVRGSFFFFALVLVLVSFLLILQRPNVIPWTITPQLSTAIGWMFFGAATYFIYGLLRPSWANAAGQLIGFLTYDLVLIGPFLSRLPSVAPEFRTGLIVYTIVVSYSGLLAVYYLFVNKQTRLWGGGGVPVISVQ